MESEVFYDKIIKELQMIRVDLQIEVAKFNIEEGEECHENEDERIMQTRLRIEYLYGKLNGLETAVKVFKQI